MTGRNRKVQRLVRARMAETGESYMTARRAVLAEQEAGEVPASDRPDREDESELGDE